MRFRIYATGLSIRFQTLQNLNPAKSDPPLGSSKSSSSLAFDLQLILCFLLDSISAAALFFCGLSIGCWSLIWESRRKLNVHLSSHRMARSRPAPATPRKRSSQNKKILCLCCGKRLSRTMVSQHEAVLRAKNSSAKAVPVPAIFPLANPTSSPLISSDTELSSASSNAGIYGTMTAIVRMATLRKMPRTTTEMERLAPIK